MVGAGIPARKDFFEQHGHRPVPSAPPHPEFTWGKFFTYVGARSRRRTRAFCSRVELSTAFAEVERMVFDGLSEAADRRAADEAAPGGAGEARRVATARFLAGRAAVLVEGFFEWVRTDMVRGHREDRRQFEMVPPADPDEKFVRAECVTCTHAAGCTEVVAGARIGGPA